MSNEITFVDTLSGINVSNGVVKLYFASLDHASAAKSAATGEAPEMRPSRTIALPMAGFLQASSIVSDLLNTAEMQAQIQRLINAGVIPLEPSLKASSELTSKSDESSSSPDKNELEQSVA